MRFRDLDDREADRLAAFPLDQAREVFRLVARTGDEHMHPRERAP